MKKIKRIDLSQTGSYTTGVMEYADEHPDARFDFTEVYDARGRFCLMVSEYELGFSERACEANGLMQWHDVQNGWQRNNDFGSILCRKGKRVIIITN